MIGESYFIKLVIPNQGEAEAELIRVKGPHLTEIIFDSLPITSRGFKRDGMFFIPINALYAVEKPSTSGRRGDIIYDSKGKSLFLLLSEKTFDTKIANIGRVNKNLEIFDKIASSAGVRIEKRANQE